MGLSKKISVLLLAMMLSPGMALASNSVLSGTFDGSEAKTAPLPGACDGKAPLAYQVTGPVKVSQSGEYTVSDAFNFNGVDVSALIYMNSFNPKAPQNNLVTPGGVDLSAVVELQAGASYVVVVQQWCENREGAWAVTLSGPGDVTSSNAVSVPAMSEGLFASSDPTVNSDCGNSRYQQTGPVQATSSGKYYFTDISARFAVDMCLQVYSAPFDAAHPAANRVGTALDDHGFVELEAGKDYYFVVQPFQSGAVGEFFYIMAPPAGFRINRSLSGSWYDPPTAGQGFLFDVFDNSNQLFLTWFTYDLERPAGNVEAMIGEPGHRWLTAVGPYDGKTASLDIYWASGMVFDSADPPLNPQVQDGTITINFTSCIAGTLDYDLGTSMVSGQVPIQPTTHEFVELCESLTGGPGQPGPL